MLIFPAIDIIDGKPVRLFKGDFSTAHQVAGDAVETAFGFLKAGCKWVHMVDLDGSLKKEPVNAQTFINVAKETGLRVELGGGIRTMNDIDFYINNGISRIILGSVALKNPELVKEEVKSQSELMQNRDMLQPRAGLKKVTFILPTLQKEWKMLVLKI